MTTGFDDPADLCSLCLFVLHLDAAAARRADVDACQEGYREMLAHLRAQPQAARRVRLAWIDAHDAQQANGGELDWAAAPQAGALRLVPDAAGAWDLAPEALSEMLPAVRRSLQEMERHKLALLAQGVPCTRPWVVLLSGADIVEHAAQWSSLAQDCRQAERDGRCQFLPVAVGDMPAGRLQLLTETPVAHLSPARFEAFFTWLAQALAAAGTAETGSAVQLPPTDGWAVFAADTAVQSAKAASALRTAPSSVPG